MTKAFISRLIQWVLTSQLIPLNACSAALLLLLLRLHRGWFPFRILFTFRGNGMCARMSWTYFSWMKWESERHSKQAISGKEINTALRQRDICRNDFMTLLLLLLIIYRACEQWTSTSNSRRRSNLSSNLKYTLNGRMHCLYCGLKLITFPVDCSRCTMLKSYSKVHFFSHQEYVVLKMKYES